MESQEQIDNANLLLTKHRLKLEWNQMVWSVNNLRCGTAVQLRQKYFIFALREERLLRKVAKPYRFDVREFAEAEGAELAAVAGGFHAAEGKTRVGSHHLIDENEARFEIVDEAIALRRIVGPRAGSQAEAAVIGYSDRFVDIFHAENTGNRSEEFFAVGGRIFGHVGKHCGFVEIPGAHNRLAAGQQFCPGSDGFLHIGIEILDRVGSCERTDFSFLVEGIAESQGFHSCNKFLFKLFGNLLVNDEAFCGNAGLSIVNGASFHGRSYRFSEVGAGHNNIGIAASELQNNFLDALRGRNAHLDARLFASGESGGGYARIV